MFRYFAGWIEDQRAPDQITHALADIIRFRLLMIAAGYEDGNDANGLRVDPIFKMALDLSRLTASCVRSRPSPDRERVRRPRPAAHGSRHGRSLLRVFPASSQAHSARYRRHVGSRRPAVTVVQCALRRIRFP